MSTGFTAALIPLVEPAWLWGLPLALAPLVREAIRPIPLRPVIAGWGSGDGADHRLRDRFRWVLPMLWSIGAMFLVVAASGPIRPEFENLRPLTKGHHWSIVLDCSGSMAQIDPGRSESRIERLSKSLTAAIEARPNDRFAVIRVAGYADRVGPTVASRRFLADQLRQIRPAQPGEDGTSLADGLILAAEALPTNRPTEEKSILLVSDGRENPPSADSFRLADVVDPLILSKVRVQWLKVEAPEDPNESPDSRVRGDSARQLTEKLVRESGGTMIDVDATSDLSAISGAALGRMAAVDEGDSRLTTASVASAIVCLAAWTLAAIFSIPAVLTIRGMTMATILRGLSLGAAASLVAFVSIDAIVRAKTEGTEQGTPKSRWAIVLDTSPSMAALDAADGSRLATARRVARGLMGRLSLEAGNEAAIVTFSARALPMAPWTDDWRALDAILDESTPYSIRPTGSDWDAALRTTLDLSSNEPTYAPPTTLVFMTDGEVGKQPSEETIDRLIRSGWRVAFVTFGDDREPGATFDQGDRSTELWIDRRTGRPARSRRDDSTAKRLIERIGGDLLPIGADDFDEAAIASGLVGPTVARTDLRDYDEVDARFEPRWCLGLAFALFIVAESAGISVFLRPSRSMANFCAGIAIASIACRPVNYDSKPLDTILDDAWRNYRQGDSLQTRAILAEAALAHPAEPALPYDLALVELIEGEPTKALATLDEAAKQASISVLSNPAERSIMMARIEAARGYGLIQEGRWGEAVKSLELAVSENALTPKETADAQANLRFAEARLEAGPKDRKTDEPAGPDRLSQRAGPSLATETEQRPTSEEQWKKLADDVRARARVARSQFEPAGDELRGPAAAPIDISAIDW